MTRQEAGRPTDRRRLELALQAAGLGEYEWDIERDVFVVSDRMAAITGLQAGERPAEGGRVLDALVHPDDLPRLIERRCAARPAIPSPIFTGGLRLYCSLMLWDARMTSSPFFSSTSMSEQMVEPRRSAVTLTTTRRISSR
jgi:PAS domain-containing protein